MKKGITSLIDSIVEKNPYDYSLWENIFTSRGLEEVHRVSAESKKHGLEGLAGDLPEVRESVPLYNDLEAFHTLCGREDREFEGALSDLPAGSGNRGLGPPERLYLAEDVQAEASGVQHSGFEERGQARTEECFSLGERMATVATLRQFFIHWLTTPVGNLETAFIAYSLFENSISSGPEVPNISISAMGLASAAESANKIVTKNLLQAGEKLVNASKVVHKSMMLLVDALTDWSLGGGIFFLRRATRLAWKSFSTSTGFPTPTGTVSCTSPTTPRFDNGDGYGHGAAELGDTEVPPEGRDPQAGPGGGLRAQEKTGQGSAPGGGGGAEAGGKGVPGGQEPPDSSKYSGTDALGQPGPASGGPGDDHQPGSGSGACAPDAAARSLDRPEARRPGRTLASGRTGPEAVQPGRVCGGCDRVPELRPSEYQRQGGLEGAVSRLPQEVSEGRGPEVGLPFPGPE
ncbi:mRNA 3' end processing protein RNA14, HAT repeats [Cryptosporidium felis]|nr:mRNA 3' end processing protein RNA14, HAT repeats [Cryptosporidium felis]